MSGEVIRLLTWRSFQAIGRKYTSKAELLFSYINARSHCSACVVAQFPRTIWINSFDETTPIEYIISHETIHQVLVWLDRPSCMRFDIVAGHPDMARTEYGGL
jgi:hypothetical protein